MSAVPARITREQLGAFLSRASAERVPLNGSIAMTNRCNLRCVHCYLGDERSPQSAARELDTAFWLSMIDQIAEAGCLNLLITGGEPFLRPDFPEVYTHAKKRGLLVTVFTNGTRFDEKLLRLFRELPPWFVEVSLYGASKETYDEVTTVAGSYERCLAGIDALVEMGVRVGLKTVILRANAHETSGMRAMAEARGSGFRVDAAIFPTLGGNLSPIELRIPAAEAVSLEMEDPRRLKGAIDYYERMKDLPAGDKLFSCMAGLTTFHIEPNGRLQPCLMTGDHGYDLRRTSFREGWEALLGFRNIEAPPDWECATCERRSICGVCPAQTIRETGSAAKKAGYYCELGRERELAMGRGIPLPALGK